MALEGLVVPSVTLFNDQGAIDGPKNSRFVRGLLDEGVRHILVLGPAGEFGSLKAPERETLLERVVESMTFGSDVWCAVTAAGSEEATQEVDQAETAGAAVIALTGSRHGDPAAHFRAVRATTKLPILAYNLPSHLGHDLPAPLLHELGKEGTIQGVIEGHGRAEVLRGYLQGAPGGFAVFASDGSGLPLPLEPGIAGACFESGNVLPQLTAKFTGALLTGTPEARAPLETLLHEVIGAYRSGPYPSSLKFLAGYLREADEGYRPPHPALSATDAARLKALVDPKKAELQEYA